MAQGQVKKKPATAATKNNKNQHRVAKPTKPKKGKSSADRMQRKLTAGLTAKTEKLLGERAGHLEMIGKGKKTEKSERVLAKGGTKKFG